MPFRICTKQVGEIITTGPGDFCRSSVALLGTHPTCFRLASRFRLLLMCRRSTSSRAAGKQPVALQAPSTPITKKRSFKKADFQGPKAASPKTGRRDELDRIVCEPFIPTYPKDCTHGEEGQPTKSMYLKVLTAYADRAWIKGDLTDKFLLDGAPKYFPVNKIENQKPYFLVPVISPEHVRAMCACPHPSMRQCSYTVVSRVQMKFIIDAWASLPHTHAFGQVKVHSLQECKDLFNERALDKLFVEILPWNEGYFVTSEPRDGNIHMFKKVLEREFYAPLMKTQGPMGYGGFFFPGYSREQAEKLGAFMEKWGYEVDIYDELIDCDDYPNPEE